MMPICIPAAWRTAALLALSTAAAMGDAHTPQESVALRVGEKKILLLPGNPTTGYAWSLPEPLPENAPVSVKLTLEPPAEPKGKAPLCGAPLNTQVTLEGLRRGNCTIVLTYARPWEKDRPPAQTRTLAVTVE